MPLSPGLLMNPSDPKGLFMKPQHLSVNDGQGIRTIIFFAGCPLRCRWCSNPESQVDLLKREMNQYLREYSVNELLKIIDRQRIFYRYSQGGVTFSGGEAACQPDMLRELTNRLYDGGIDLAMETSGFFDFNVIKDILIKMDLIFVDIKHMEDDRHRQLTGRGNKLILKNIQQVAHLGIPLVIRIPVIAGVNSDPGNIEATARFVKDHVSKPKIEILPYHSFADVKYESLGKVKPSEDYSAPGSEELEEIRGIIKAQGVELVSYH